MTIDIPGFHQNVIGFDNRSYSVYRAGTGPGVIVIHEVPGITPPVIEFARRVVDRGFTVMMPSLFGTPMKPYSPQYAASSLARACVSREFHCFATASASPITVWLRHLARRLHEEVGGPGVGVVGMCLTGGFALAMMVDDTVAAPVLSQPAIPLPIGSARQASLGLSQEDLETVSRRADEGCQVLGLRFTSDPSVRASRFETLRNLLGENFIGVEIDSSRDNPHGISRMAHSVLTEHLVEEDDHPTTKALELVLSFFDDKLKETG